MLKLKSPLQLGTLTYDVLHFGQIMFDTTARLFDVRLRPAQEQADHIRVGSRREKGTGFIPLPPLVVGTLRLADTPEGSPRFAAILAKFQEASEELEKALAEDGSFERLEFETGEEVFSLACDYLPSDKPLRTLEKAKKEHVLQ